MRKSITRFQIKVELTSRAKKKVKTILSKGIHDARTIRRAQALRLLGDGKSVTEAAEALGIAENTVRRVAMRYQKSGLKKALKDDPRPGKKPILTEKQSQEIIALVCGPAPNGFARWSVRLLTEEVKRRGITPQIGREKIRLLLENHELKPWREKNVVRPKDHSRVYGEDAGRPINLRVAP